MKGLSKITELLNDFVKTIDEELSVEEDSDFAYYPLSNKITYSLVVSEKNNTDFMRSVEFFKPKVKCDIFLWSVLHEIGYFCSDLCLCFSWILSKNHPSDGRWT